MKTFDYDDIQLIPSKCVIKSRKEADTSVQFGPRTFKIPVVPANMESVIDEDLAVWLAQNGYYYVMHRFEPADRLASFSGCTSASSLHPFPWELRTRNTILSTN